jgi:hypothetical protein
MSELLRRSERSGAQESRSWAKYSAATGLGWRICGHHAKISDSPPGSKQRVVCRGGRGILPRARFGEEASDQAPGLAANLTLEIRQGQLGSRARAFGFQEENRQGTKEGQVACGVGFAHGAAVLVLGAVPAVVLAVLDGPVTAGQLLQSVWAGLLRPEAGKVLRITLVGEIWGGFFHAGQGGVP